MNYFENICLSNPKSMKKTFFYLSTLLFALLISFNLKAQKANPFTAQTANTGKIKTSLDFPAEGRTSKNGGGYSTNVDLLDPKPKNVALVGYYVYDPASGKGGQSSNANTITYSAEIWRTADDVAQKHVDGFYSRSIEPLKAGFKEYGINILTPAEFLDTDEKKEFFEGFSQESGKKEKTTRRAIGPWVSVEGSTIKSCPTDGGYRPFFVANEPMNVSQYSVFINMGIGGANRKMTSSLGYELAKGLEVDAVVVCYIVIRKPKRNKEDYLVDAVAMHMFGPNPVKNSPEDKNRGQFYGSARYFAKQSLFANSKSGVTSYDNIDNVMTALSTRIANWVINKAKK